MPEEARSQLPAIAQPFTIRMFRFAWPAGLFSNLGTLIQLVAAGWAMTEMTGNPEQVALLQTATSAPMMLFAMICGSLADLYDRRKIALSALAIGAFSAVSMYATSITHTITPHLLIALCLITGMGNALYAPSWHASVREQVPRDFLPAAIALNSMSFNLGRTLGPAIGGILVAVIGVSGAFLANAISFLPIFAVFLLWRSPQRAASHARERLWSAVAGGIRYVVHSPPLRHLLTRVVIQSFGNSAVLALLVLYVRRELGGAAFDYGVALAFFGVGAVCGAALVPGFEARFGRHRLAVITGVVMGLALIWLELAWSLPLAWLALLPAGLCWTAASTLFNVSAQTMAPPWVAGRVLASFQMSISAGVALGSWFWGAVAAASDIRSAMLFAGVACLVSQLALRKLRLPEVPRDLHETRPEIDDPQLPEGMTAASGPVVIQVGYCIAQEDTGKFIELMKQVGQSRRRCGARQWQIIQGTADDRQWTEEFRFQTWNDYLRYRNRHTVQERRMLAQVRRLHQGGGQPVTKRFLTS